MAITYEQIQAANGQLSTIDLKGKAYVMVPQRVKAFRMLYPDGFIRTEIMIHENGLVMMQARAGYYTPEHEEVVLGTGMAFEERGKGMVNGTSYIENCETSAVGRALGFLALGVDGGGICSAEELVNALTAQRQMEQQNAQKQAEQQNAQKQAEQQKAQKQRANQPPVKPVENVPVQVQTAQTVPPVQEVPPVEQKPTTAADLIRQANKDLMKRGINLLEVRNRLIAEGKLEKISSEKMKLEEAQKMIAMIEAECGKKAS